MILSTGLMIELKYKILCRCNGTQNIVIEETKDIILNNRGDGCKL